MKVIAIIPVFGRLPLLKYTIQRLYEKNKVDLVICVGATEKEMQLCQKMDAVFFKHPNNPLGMKWNYGFKQAREYKPDAILFVGSSDWLSGKWLGTVSPYLNDFDLVGKPDFYMLDINKRQRVMRACHWKGYQDNRKGEPIGIGRMVSAEIMNKIDWEPFDNRKNYSMDFQMMQKVTAAGGKIKNLEDGSILSLSLSCDQWDNKHKFEEHWSNKLPSDRVSAEEIVARFPEALEIFPELKPKYINE